MATTPASEVSAVETTVKADVSKVETAVTADLAKTYSAKVVLVAAAIGLVLGFIAGKAF